MFKHDILAALRSFKKHKAISLINFIGLSLGISSCLIIFVYIRNELTFNHSYPNASRIAKIVTDIKTPESFLYLAKTPVPLAGVLKRNYPEVEDAARLSPVTAIVNEGRSTFKEPNVFLADSSALNVFSLTLEEGNSKGLLGMPNTAVITPAIARKYFGQEDPLDKTIKCNGTIYTIKGVMSEGAANTDLKINMLLSKDMSASEDWLEDFPVYTYVLFKNAADLGTFEKKFEPIVEKYINPGIKSLGMQGYSFNFKLDPIEESHYSKERLEDLPAAKGNKQVIYLFSFLAIFVLAIALLNYINLMTAKAPERAKEVGIKKINGASRLGLFRQFLVESSLLTLAAILLSAVLMFVLIPLLNKEFHIKISWEFSASAWYVLLSLLVISVVSSLYPALVMSGYNPIVVLKGKFSNYGKGLILRKVFTTVQFVLTVGMISSVLIIYRQMRYMEKYDLGFDQQRLLTIHLPADSTVRKNVTVIVNALRQQKDVADVTVGTGLQPGSNTPMATTIIQYPTGGKRELMTNCLFVDERTVPTLDLKLVEGRNLSNDEGDRMGGFLVNEAFIRNVGRSIGIGTGIQAFDHKGKIVGVVRNFNYQSIHNLIQPLVMLYNTGPAESITVKLKTVNVDALKEVWTSYFPDFPFEFSFVEEAFNEQYQSDRSVALLFELFAFMVSFLSFLGLYALLSLNIFRRTKEIGMRKVMGASFPDIFMMLYKDFFTILLVSVLLAAPITWIGMNKWLQNFAYRETIQWSIFLASGLITFIISLVIVDYGIIKVAKRPIVESLHVE